MLDEIRKYADSLSVNASCIADTMDLVLIATENAICSGNETEVSRKAVSALNLISTLLHEHEEAFGKLSGMLMGMKEKSES